MNKKQMVQKLAAEATEPAWSRIRLLGIKLRSLGHLVGSQATNEDPPLDYADVLWGCGLLMEEIAASMRQLSNELERKEIGERVDKRSRKKTPTLNRQRT